MSNVKFKLNALAASVVMALGSTPQAVAQDSTFEEEEIIEEIVVTGTHIRRTGFEGRAPIQVVDAEAIATLGVNQPAEVLKDLTVNSGSQLYNETNSRAGTGMFNIRNLGLGSTLTLLNGRRAGVAPVADATGTNFVDINQFPIAMIKRMEVLTDGASATYGSQAVAGVVNIITRKGFEGFEISGGGSWSEVATSDINIAAGSQFERGGFNLYATYYEQDFQDRSDFDWMHDRLIGDTVVGDIRTSRFLSSTGSPGTYRKATIGSNGEATDVAGAVNNPDPDCEAAGGVIRVDAPSICRHHFVDQVSIISAEERAQIFTEFDWQFTDNLTYYAEASYSHNIVKRSMGARTLNTGQATGGGFTIPGDHPFNFFIEDPVDPTALIYIGPDAWDPLIHTGADLRAIARPLGAEEDHNDNTQQTRRQFDYVRFVNGIEFDLQNSWIIDASYSFSGATLSTDVPHTYRSDIFQQLVKDGEWNPFGTRLSDPGIVSPKDGFSTAANDRITQDKFDQRRVDVARTRETVVDVIASGDLLEMGGNIISSAIGTQYRDVTLKDIPDSLTAAGEANEASTRGFVSGSQDVLAVFGEVIAPVGDDIELQLALRREDYGGSVGSTTDPKFSMEFRPVDWLGFRGSWGTSFQAPTVRQTAEATSSAFIDDPASSTGPGGSLVCVSAGLATNITVAVVGSPNLRPQESENFNLGVMLQNEEGFRASIDYWNFDYTDLIAQSESAQAIVNNDCLDDGIPNDPRIIRDAGGQLRQVNSEFVNIGLVETDGLDFSADYLIDVGGGQLILDVAATYVLNFDVDTDGDGTTEFDGAGNRNFSNNFSTMPELRAHGGASFLFGDHSANITVRYIDGYKNDQSHNADVDSMTTVDLQYSLRFPGLIGDSDTRISIGANNVFDEDPPALYRNNADGTRRALQNPTTGIFDGIDRPGYDPRAGHDIRGRILYAKFVVGF